MIKRDIWFSYSRHLVYLKKLQTINHVDGPNKATYIFYIFKDIV